MDYAFSFSFRKKQPLFTDFSLHIEDSRINVICGHNGAGKTTLLKVLSGFLPSNLQNPSGWLVPVNGGLIQEFTLQEHLALMNKDTSSSPGTGDDIAAEAFSLFNAAEFATKKISRLSTGQTAMAAIIVALSSDSPLLLLDEPFSGLDPVNADTLASLLKKCGRTVIVTSHDLFMTSEIADEIRILKNGAVTWSWSRTERDRSSAPNEGALTVEALKDYYARFA